MKRAEKRRIERGLDQSRNIDIFGDQIRPPWPGSDQNRKGGHLERVAREESRQNKSKKTQKKRKSSRGRGGVGLGRNSEGRLKMAFSACFGQEKKPWRRKGVGRGE